MPAQSAFGAFHHRTFTVLWTATVVSNIGGWMYSAASAWLMTTLEPSPLAVSLVQVATSLPTFLFAGSEVVVVVLKKVAVPEFVGPRGSADRGGR